MITILLFNLANQLPPRIMAELAACGGKSGNTTCSLNLPQVNASATQVHDILSVVFGIIAALSVLMIVIAGLRFITAQGNPQELGKARSTILYAIVGLLIALAAESIVQLVAGKL